MATEAGAPQAYRIPSSEPWHGQHEEKAGATTARESNYATVTHARTILYFLYCPRCTYDTIPLAWHGMAWHDIGIEKSASQKNIVHHQTRSGNYNAQCHRTKRRDGTCQSRRSNPPQLESMIVPDVQSGPTQATPDQTTSATSRWVPFLPALHYLSISISPSGVSQNARPCSPPFVESSALVRLEMIVRRVASC